VALDAVLQEIINHLLNALIGKDQPCRGGAALAVTRLRGEPAAEILFDQYGNGTPEEFLALALTPLSPDKTAQILISALNDPQLAVRSAASQALAQIRTPQIIRGLVNAVEHHVTGSGNAEGLVKLVSEESLIAAVETLGELANEACVRTMRKLISFETNSKIKASGISALGSKPDEQYVPFFQGVLKDADPRVRANALESIARSGSKAVVGMLQPYLDDPHHRIRANAALGIWKYGDFEVSATIKEMLKNGDEKHRLSAVYVIGQCRIEAYLKNVQDLIAAPDVPLRKHAIRALGNFKKPELVEPFLGKLAEPEESIRLVLVEAILDVLGKKALPALMQHVKSEKSPVIRARIARAFGAWADPATVSHVADMLKDPDPTVVAGAVESLMTLIPVSPPAALVERMKSLLVSENQRLRVLAVTGLWNWGVPEIWQLLLKMITHAEVRVNAWGFQCLAEVLGLAVPKGGPTIESLRDFLLKTAEGRKKILAQELAHAAQGQIKTQLDLALADVRAGKNREAIERLEDVLKIAPNNLQALVTLGDIHFHAEKFEKARELFVRALQFQPNLSKALYSLGMIYQKSRDWAKAREVLVNLIKINPQLAQPYLLLAEVFEGEGKMGECLGILKKLQSLAPQNIPVMMKLARISFLAGAVNEGFLWAQKAGSLGAVDDLTRLILAFGDYVNQNPAEGFRKLFQIFRIVAENPQVLPIAEVRKCLQVAEGLLVQNVRKE
jgi:HEAT repeat protein